MNTSRSGCSSCEYDFDSSGMSDQEISDILNAHYDAEHMRASRRTIPASGDPYTHSITLTPTTPSIKLSVDVSEAIATLKRLIAAIEPPPSPPPPRSRFGSGIYKLRHITASPATATISILAASWFMIGLATGYFIWS